MQIIQKIAAWTAEQPAWDYDAEALTEYSRMTRCSNNWSALQALPSYLQRPVESKRLVLAELIKGEGCYRFRLQGNPTITRQGKLRGIEGARVRETYKLLAKQYGVDWRARNYDRQHLDAADTPNRCVSAATSCLYGITEAAVLAAGYAPAVGFIHSGKPLSFVYDIADLFKFETVVPLAFKIAAKSPHQPERELRLGCRDLFRSSKILAKMIPTIEEVLSAGGISPPEAPPDSIPAAISNSESFGDIGHRA